MTALIIIAVPAVVIIAAVRYVYKAKESGARCIGCSIGEGGCCCSHNEATEVPDSESHTCCCGHTNTK